MLEGMQEKIEILRNSFNEGIPFPAAYREKQLLAISKFMTEHEEDICEALKKDLNKNKHESLLYEIRQAQQDLLILYNNLHKLMRGEQCSRTLVTLTDSVYLKPQPYGVVLIIGPWNFPFSLVIQPLLGAIAAGNCVMLKPSEVSVNIMNLLADMLPQYLNMKTVQIICGGLEVNQELLKQRFDLIFFTGSTRIGRIVMEAASKHLTPVLLELGGKSPVYVHTDADLNITCKRIVSGKLVNCGQTCIAPDYILCMEPIVNEFIEKCKSAITTFYGDEVEQSDDYCKIINDASFNRLVALLNNTKGNVVIGGKHNAAERFIEPTIVRDVSLDDSLMSEELFGPILPVIAVKDEKEAIRIINKREKSLAVYAFTNSSNIMKQFESSTFSGALMFNDVLCHAGIPNLPFGGVGESGQGCYHGKYSFDAFSHRRSYVNKDTREIVNDMIRYPPYTDSKIKWINRFFHKTPFDSYCFIL